MGAPAQPPAPQGADSAAAERKLVHLGVAAAVTGMLCWITGIVLIPPAAKLDEGDAHLAEVLRAHSAQLYAAATLAVLGAVLLATFFCVLSCLVDRGWPGWAWLRVSLAACVITQTMVAVGASFRLAGVYAAAGDASPAVIAVGQRGLSLTFLASAPPTIMFTVAAVLGLRQARLSPPWVSALGWLSAAAHLLAMFALAQRGALAPDGIIATFTPLTTVIWILALAAALPRSWQAAAPAPQLPALHRAPRTHTPQTRTPSGNPLKPWPRTCPVTRDLHLEAAVRRSPAVASVLWSPSRPQVGRAPPRHSSPPPRASI